MMAGTSPAGPHRCGSTTCSVKAVAMPASNALPPRSKIDMPTAVPIQCVEATTPNVPSITGRVIKGSGLTKDIRSQPHEYYIAALDLSTGAVRLQDVATRSVGTFISSLRALLHHSTQFVFSEAAGACASS